MVWTGMIMVWTDMVGMDWYDIVWLGMIMVWTGIVYNIACRRVNRDGSWCQL